MANLAQRYITAKYQGATRDELIQLRNDAATEIKDIEAAKSDIYARFPGVHGRFQQSQLDVLSNRKDNARALYDNVLRMIG